MTHTTHTHDTQSARRWAYVTLTQYANAIGIDTLQAKADMVARDAHAKRGKRTHTERLWDYYNNIYNNRAENRAADLETAAMLQAGIDPLTGIHTGTNMLIIKLNK